MKKCKCNNCDNEFFKLAVTKQGLEAQVITCPFCGSTSIECNNPIDAADESTRLKRFYETANTFDDVALAETLQDLVTLNGISSKSISKKLCTAFTKNDANKAFAQIFGQSFDSVLNLAVPKSFKRTVCIEALRKNEPTDDINADGSIINAADMEVFQPEGDSITVVSILPEVCPLSNKELRHIIRDKKIKEGLYSLTVTHETADFPHEFAHPAENACGVRDVNTGALVYGYDVYVDSDEAFLTIKDGKITLEY